MSNSTEVNAVPVGFSFTAFWLRGVASEVERGELSLDELGAILAEWLEYQDTRRRLPE